MRSIQADLVGVSEVGLKWNKMKEKETWADRVRGQFRSEQSKWARNKKDPIHGKTQWGGTGIMVTSRLTAKIQDGKPGDRDMGRWTWMTLRGGTHGTVVITVYNPVYNKRGPGSVYLQQVAALLEEGIRNNPCKVLRQDLKAEIRRWRDNNRHIIVMGDINENIYTGQISEML